MNNMKKWPKFIQDKKESPDVSISLYGLDVPLIEPKSDKVKIIKPIIIEVKNEEV
jgi:hypothetical protein